MKNKLQNGEVKKVKMFSFWQAAVQHSVSVSRAAVVVTIEKLGQDQVY